MTKAIWKNMFYDENIFGDKYVTNFGTAFCLMLSILTIPLDIILLPLEIIALFVVLILGEL